MHRLQGFTDADVLEAEKLLIDAVVHALQVVCNEMADRIGQVTVAAASEPDPKAIAKAMVDAAAGGPPGQPYVSVDDLAAMPGLWTGQIQNLIMPLTGEIYRDAAGTLHAELVDLVGPQVPAIGSQAAESYLAAAAARWEFIGDDVWATARTELLDGFQQGESIPKLAARVRSAAVLSQRNATAVARTEVVAASNAGSFATAQVSGLEMSKVWLATDDERTRPTHNAADGQVQPLAQPFTVGISSLAFPGDPGGAPEEVKNCRCTLTYDIPDETVTPQRTQPPPPDTAEPDVSPLEVAARARQAEIDEVRKVATAASEVDELISNEVSDTALTKRIQATADRIKLDDTTRDELLGAVAAGDRTQLARIADRVAADAGLTPIEQAGDIVTFDPTRHKPIGESLRRGQKVEVVRRGYLFDRPGEEQPIQISKAVVEEADPGAVLTVRAAAPEPVAPTLTTMQTAQARLADLADQTPTGTPRQLGGGEIADTNLLTYVDGTRVVEKVYGRRVSGSKAEIRRQAEAEELGALVLDAVGVRTPAVLRTTAADAKQARLLMEFIDGDTGAEIVPWGTKVPESILESDDGRLIGLADLLMGHGDRHTGNWIRLPNGRLAAIDQGEAFHHSDLYLPGSTVFGEYLTELQGFSSIVIKKAGIDLHPDDLALIRGRLEALRPEFEARNRMTWYRATLRLLKKVEAGADGTRRRLS